MSVCLPARKTSGAEFDAFPINRNKKGRVKDAQQTCEGKKARKHLHQSPFSTDVKTSGLLSGANRRPLVVTAGGGGLVRREEMQLTPSHTSAESQFCFLGKKIK